MVDMKKILLFIWLLLPVTLLAQTSNKASIVGNSSESSYDPDAQAFINALNADPSGVKLTATQREAINFLVAGLKGIQDTGQTTTVWDRCLAIYPFIGGDAFKHKFNLKDPRDLDAAYRLFFNACNHSITGINTSNSTAGYANSFVNPSVVQSLGTGFSMSFYSYVNTALNDLEYLMGVTYENGTSTGNGNTSLIGYRTNGSTIFLNTSESRINDRIDATVSGGNGFFLGNYLTEASLYKEGIKLNGTVSTVENDIIPNGSIYILNRNRLGLTGDLTGTNKTCAFSHIGYGLTENEAIWFNRIVQIYQSILSRNPFQP